VVVRVLERKVPAQKPLEQVRADIHAVLAKQGADKEAERMGKAMIAEVKSGKTLADVAQGSKFTVKELGWIGRKDGKGTPSAVLTAAFQLPAPAGKKPDVGGVRLHNGDYAVFSVNGVKRPVPDAKTASTAQTQLGDMFGQVELQVVYQALERADTVKVYPNNLNF
jgi:hypothetical protein